MPARPSRARTLALLGCAVLALTGASCPDPDPDGFPLFFFASPEPGLLSGENAIHIELQFPFFMSVDQVEVEVDGTPSLSLAGGSLRFVGSSGRVVEGDLLGLPPAAGPAASQHALVATARVRMGFYSFDIRTTTWLERVALDRPDDCEVLNGVECLLPFPSSRYLETADTETGFRVAYPDGALPRFGGPLDATAYAGQDGFSPGVQVLMHFVGGVDPELSGASRLLETTRTHDASSLDPGSPTLLLDASDGMKRVLHWVEPDSRAIGTERQALILRPAQTLEAGHRYIVAMRDLVRPDGTDVTPEPVFATLRDGRATDIAAVESRRAGAEALFAELDTAGVERDGLLLAFDFVVQSDEDLTGALLAMRDRAFGWLAQQDAGDGLVVFPFVAPGEAAPDADVSLERDCAVAGERTWREVRGTFETPLFLSSDPLLDPKDGSRLVDDDGDGLPEIQGTMAADFSITIPCAALDHASDPLLPILTGHGLFGNGRQIVNIPQALGSFELSNGGSDFERISGATTWLGLSSNDLDFNANPVDNFIVQAVLLDPDNFGALPDRLRQGVANTLVLARMMKEGFFNANDAFRLPAADGTPGAGPGVFPGDTAPLDYTGISLGGVMGTLVAAVSPDVDRFALDVPAANFSILIQRSTAISLIEIILNTQNPDPMSQLLFMGLIEELWDSGEPVGYLRHVTRDPLPGSGAAKDLLYMVGEHDGVVANTASSIAIRSLGLPNLFDAAGPAGSSFAQQPGIPDVASVSAADPNFVGASIWYDLGSYGDPLDDALLGFVPPLSNAVAGSRCDPHGRTFSTGAEARQIVTFLSGGNIENFCDGVCDGFTSSGNANPFELPSGASGICDPTL